MYQISYSICLVVIVRQVNATPPTQDVIAIVLLEVCGNLSLGYYSQQSVEEMKMHRDESS